MGRVRTVPCLCELYPGICLRSEEKHGKTCQGSRRVPVGTMKTEYTEQNILYTTLACRTKKYNMGMDRLLIKDYWCS